MKDVIAALRKQRKTHTAALKQIDAMLKKAGVSEGKAKRRRQRVATKKQPPTTIPVEAKAKATPQKPPVKALRAALKANGKKAAATPTPANGKSRATASSDLFGDD